MTSTLLRTKLYIPRPASTLVPRDALVQRLAAGIDHDLTLVVAPVGYGKTVLVTTWAAQTPLPVAWLTLNENDNDLVTFVAYLIAAMQTVFPTACPQTQSFLESGRMPEVDQLATLLINEIDDLPQRFVLVLDDYHWIQAPVVHQLLDNILRHPPLQMHLLIASRADPPLALARLRAAQRLNELRIVDLRFSPAEAELFLAQTTEQAGQDNAAQVLVRCTEGWIAGLQLAALSLRLATDQTTVLQHLERGVDRYIMDYLLEQVLNQQPPAIQKFLLQTSILERISPALAQAVVANAQGHVGEQVALSALERAGIFVSALDNTGEWYSYHALFRELLRHQLQQRYSRAEIMDLHERATAWFRAAHLVDDALHHALAAENVDLAATIIIDHFATWLDRENWPAVERWLGLLPAAAFTSHPWLLVARANIAQIRSDYGAVLPLLAEAEARLADAHGAVASHGEAVLRGYLDLLWAIHWLLGDAAQKAVTAAEHALQSLPPAHRYVRGTALNVLTMALQVSGEVTAATQLVEDELARTPRAAAGAYTRLRLLLCLMSLHLADGRLAPGEEIANMLLEEATAFNAPISQLWAHLVLGVIAYETNDLPRALSHFTHGVDLRYVGHTRGGHECLAHLALTYQALGRTGEAQGIARMMNEYHRQSGNIVLGAEARALQVHLNVLAGVLPDRHAWGEPRAATAAIALGWQVIPAVTQIYFLLAEASPAALRAAGDVVDALLHIATNLHKPARMAELLALKARLHQQQMEHAAAAAMLKLAVAIGEPRGLIRSLVDAGPSLEPVVQTLAQTAPSPYLQHLLVAMRRPAASAPGDETAPAQAGETVRLTRREREVLALLIAYKTDREIAEQLVVSPLTVRTHIEHLSEKLEVSGRRAIIARAAEMNLLG